MTFSKTKTIFTKTTSSFNNRVGRTTSTFKLHNNTTIRFSFFSSTTIVSWFSDPFVSSITNPSGEEEEEEEEVWACGFGSDGGCGGDGFMFLFWRKRVSAMEAEMEGLWVRHRGYSWWRCMLRIAPEETETSPTASFSNGYLEDWNDAFWFLLTWRLKSVYVNETMCFILTEALRFITRVC